MKTLLRTALRSFALTFAIGLPFAIAYRSALAQDRAITVREVDVTPRKAEIDVLSDGGCLLAGYATVVSPSVEPTLVRAQYPFNGARCTTVKNAIIAAAKKDLAVGNGADP